jgi:aminomethyltransferase
MLTNAKGGIIDDLMVSKDTDHLRLVVNGSRVHVDLAHLGDELGGDTTIDYRPERALVALQGPAAVAALSSLNVAIAEMSFMSFIDTKLAGKPVSISRCGYTGEDGFEISAAVGDMDELARIILDHADVEAAGLGARDSLRLEAGLCLYGQDIDDTTSPIEAGLHWTITKKRLETGGFLGANIIQNHAKSGTDRCLVGLVPEGRAPARAGVAILDSDGAEIGIVTSGGFGATLGGPMALGYVPSTLSKANTKLKLQIRKSQVPATVTTLPFVPHRYFQRTNRS